MTTAKWVPGATASIEEMTAEATAEAEAPETTGSASASADEGAFLADVKMAPVEGEGGEAVGGDFEGETEPEPAGVDLTAEGFVPVEVFAGTVRGATGMASAMTQLASVAIGQDEMSDAALEAAYECILDTPALHFLIRPEGVWAKRAMAIGVFAVPYGLGIRAEVMERRAARLEAARAARAAANDNRAQAAPPGAEGGGDAPGGGQFDFAPAA